MSRTGARGALALLAVVGVVLAGCGSTKTSGSGTRPLNGSLARSITVAGRAATIPNVKTGTRVTCKGWPGPGAKVPPPGGGVAEEARQDTVTSGPASTGPSSSRELQLRHLRNGSITVSCTRSG
jgi:hypothetical protein